MYIKLKKIFFIFLGVTFTGVISIFFTSDARQEGVSLLDLDFFPTVHADIPHNGAGDSGDGGQGDSNTGDSTTGGSGTPSGCSAANSSSSIGGTP